MECKSLKKKLEECFPGQEVLFPCDDEQKSGEFVCIVSIGECAHGEEFLLGRELEARESACSHMLKMLKTKRDVVVVNHYYRHSIMNFFSFTF